METNAYRKDETTCDMVLIETNNGIPIHCKM